MATVEIGSNLYLRSPEDIINNTIYAHFDFTSDEHLTINGSNQITRVDDRLGGTAYGLQKGTAAEWTLNSNGIMCWDPTTASSKNNTWFRTYNLPATGSNVTVLFIGARVNAGAQIVGTNGDSVDDDGLHFNNGYFFGRARSGTTFYYTPVNSASDGQDEVFCGGFRAKDGNPSVANNWSVHVNGSELSGDVASGTNYYNSYQLTALGNGRNGATTQYRSPLIHEVMYIAGALDAQEWTDIMTKYVTPKYGIS